MENPINHVFVLALENRSFDHLLAYSGIPGLTGVNTTMTNPDKSGSPVPMTSDTPDRLGSDPGHEFEDVDWQIYGATSNGASRPITMNGFANRDWPEAMRCANPALVPNLTRLGRQFVVCDQWYSSMPGPTWPNRFFMHAGSSGGLANSPSNLTTIGSMLWSELGFSFENGTLYSVLENAGRTWRVYHGDHFPQVCAIDTMPAVFVADTDRFRKMDFLAADVRNGDVANYTFIEPNYSILSSFRDGDCQHPSGALSAGEQLIATVANAVMDPSIWMSSLLIILYDEHGGFYDQLPPMTGRPPPGDAPLNASKAANPPTPVFEFDRYGIRVPAVVVSPWVKPGVDHAIYDHASLVRTVFDVFGMPGHLTDRDKFAASLGSLLQQTAAAAAPEALPAPTPVANGAAPLAAEPRLIHSLNGFARIAAQVHHALRNYQTGMQAEELHKAISTADDLSRLPGLPTTEDQGEARRYIQLVAGELELHRQRQRRGRP
jgi:phospholipase C